MLTYFPKYFSNRAIVCYLITLASVSVLFMRNALPFQFMMFGLVAVFVFFNFSSRLTIDWRRYSVRTFTKKLFETALVIRMVYVIFIYFYYIEMTGQPHMFQAGDELYYKSLATLWRQSGFDEQLRVLKMYGVDFSDSGYFWFLAFEYMLFGIHDLPARLIKCLLSAYSCVLMYKIAQRNFGEEAARMTGIFCMLMPNMWFYCGVTLKETEMAFLIILFAERADSVLHSRTIKVVNMLLPASCILIMFTFRTALAAVMFASMAAALIFTSSRQLNLGLKIVYVSIFSVWMMVTVGVEMLQETQQLWSNRSSNQEVGYEARRDENSFAKYASATVLAPLIFTIPFSSLVATPGQENQMMLNGSNFIKNVTSGLTIFALFVLLLSGDWRKHVLTISLTCGYLVVLVFSNFAHSERFHFPVLAFELMFAAYGVTQLKNKHKRWFMMWLGFVCVANIAWAWVKLKGRGII